MAADKSVFGILTNLSWLKTVILFIDPETGEILKSYMRD